MPKVFTQQGRHTGLPIVGDTVAEVCIASHRGPAIIFADAGRQESIIEVADQFSIGRGTEMCTVPHDQPHLLSPLLELVDATVAGATAHADGRLRVEFSNRMRMEVASTTGFEAWHFQFPRPGRPPGGDAANHISIHGSDGQLQ